jgi:transcriptional regulator with XRE-family HTH domain
MSTIMEDFTNWLLEELNKRGWSRSEAARRGEISASMFDKVINGHAAPGLDFCTGVARAFGIPRPEDVMIRAGLLPPIPKETERLREVNTLFAQLSDDEQEMMITQIRALVGRKREPIVKTG